MTANQSNDGVYYTVGVLPKVARQLSLRARDHTFRIFVEYCIKLAEEKQIRFDELKILDFGTSGVDSLEANVLLKCLPLGPNLTCAGLDKSTSGLSDRPNTSYVQITRLTHPMDRLPFQDRQFSVVHCNAVFEHVGDSVARAHLYSELTRISELVFIAVPNRWFPIEHHTGIPLVHWIPSLFRWICNKVPLLTKWASSDSLEFLSKKMVENELCLGEFGLKASGYSGVGMAMFSSNFWTLLTGNPNRRGV